MGLDLGAVNDVLSDHGAKFNRLDGEPSRFRYTGRISKKEMFGSMFLEITAEILD